jgi:hypothetical protein
VGVDPEDAEFLVQSTGMRSHTGDSAHRDGMIAAEHKRNFARPRDLFDFGSEERTGPDDFGEVPQLLVLDSLQLRNLGGDISFIDDGVPKGAESPRDAGNTDRRRAHIDTPPSSTQIHRHANDMNLHTTSQFLNPEAALEPS